MVVTLVVVGNVGQVGLRNMVEDEDEGEEQVQGHVHEVEVEVEGEGDEEVAQNEPQVDHEGHEHKLVLTEVQQEELIQQQVSDGDGLACYCFVCFCNRIYKPF